jgi:hypothetical protein
VYVVVATFSRKLMTPSGNQTNLFGGGVGSIIDLNLIQTQFALVATEHDITRDPLGCTGISYT